MLKNISLPHNELVVGMTGSGKTHYLIHHLESIMDNNPSLLKIFIICPTIKYNRTFQEWKLKPGNKRKVHYIGCHQDSVNSELREILGKCKTGDNKGSDKVFKTLVVLDDCAHGNDVKGKTSELVELAYTARHLGIGTIVLTQQLTSIAKAYRENITRLVTFYNSSRKDTMLLFDDYLGSTPKDERKDIQHKLKTKRYCNLVVNLKFPYDHSVSV